MKVPSETEIKVEAEVLDKVTGFLDRAENRRGRTQREIAVGTDLAIGRVAEICRKSEIVLRRRPRNSNLWYNDWEMCEPGFRPVRKLGRPRKT